jgi:hypothetical protein
MASTISYPNILPDFALYRDLIRLEAGLGAKGTASAALAL